MAKEKNIKFVTVVEMLGRPKEHVTQTLKKIVQDLKDNGAYEIVKETYEDPIEQETMFSSFVELEILTSDISNIAWFCFDFLPASVEIVEPENVSFKAYELSSFLNELTTRMHIVDKEMKRMQQESLILNKNAKQIIKNSIVVCLTKQEMTMPELVKFTGVPEKLLAELADELIKQDLILKSDELYKLK